MADRIGDVLGIRGLRGPHPMVARGPHRPVEVSLERQVSSLWTEEARRSALALSPQMPYVRPSNRDAVDRRLPRRAEAGCKPRKALPPSTRRHLVIRFVVVRAVVIIGLRRSSSVAEHLPGRRRN